MSLSVGIVGLPNVGKSTLFNALLKKQQALAANYPFATIEPNVGIVPVPDWRLQKLAETIASERVHVSGMGAKETLTYTKLPPLVPATVTFTDIAGLVAGAHKGEGLGNKFLAHIRETDAIAFVIRAFEDGDVVRAGSVDPKSDLETVKTELMIADIQTLEKQREPRGNATPEERKKWALIQRLMEALNANHMANEVAVTDDEAVWLKELFLLSAKPAIYVVNVGETDVARIGEIRPIMATELGVTQDAVVLISAKMEAELAALDIMEQQEYLTSYGLSESGLERLITAAYETLGLMSFLTAGEKEVRAWTIRKGISAQAAAGVIHTDFIKKFIKADVIHWEQYVSAGGWKKAREEGLVRSEGRDYLMQDGDVVEFKIGT